MIESKRVTVQKIIADIGSILRKIRFVLNDHEKRLQMIEALDLKIELDLLRQRVAGVSDGKKQADALQAFKNLCDSLGLPDLESTQR